MAIAHAESQTEFIRPLLQQHDISHAFSVSACIKNRNLAKTAKNFMRISNACLAWNRA